MKKLFLLLAAMVMLTSTDSWATLWQYSGTGSVMDKDGLSHNLYTSMVISDLPRYYAGYDPASGTQGGMANLSSATNSQIYYWVAGFQISIADIQVLAGDGLIFGSTGIPQAGYLSLDEWQLSAQAAGRSTGVFFDATFMHYDTDGTPWEFKDPLSAHYGLIGPMIDLGPAMSLFEQDLDLFGGLFTTFNPIDLTIARDPNGISEAPVPEPATLLLIGTGLVGIVSARKMRKTVKTVQ